MTRRPAPLWLAGGSRFSRMPAGKARMVLASAALLIFVCWSALLIPVPRGMAAGQAGDVELYGAIVDGIRHGGGYYTVAADALRAGDYPLRPFVTFRLPTLAVIQGALPGWLVVVLLGALISAVLIAWYKKLAPAMNQWPPRFALLIITAGGLVASAQVTLDVFHEVWAGLLIALSLAIRRPGRVIEAISYGTCAMLLRETAALYVAIMAAAALWDGERREAAGWAGALVLLAIAVVCHAYAVSAVVRPLDPTSPGWTGLLGLGLFVNAMAQSTALSLFPLAVSAPLVGVALVGWAGLPNAFGARVTMVLVSYALLLSLFGRVDNVYWGLLVAPLLLPGLLLAPDAVRDLVVASLDRRRITVTRLAR